MSHAIAPRTCPCSACGKSRLCVRVLTGAYSFDFCRDCVAECVAAWAKAARAFPDIVAKDVT